ncbi:AraC family transcriptional regulator [Psychromonas aquatilis]|uniref:AraC family transcriptional regulator n=1 Tax=Psychromonas aquatilis TaxID=2005072 RepID=A0ABU9GNZ9_9GAMM
MRSKIVQDQRNQPQVLVENKIAFAGEESELSLYDTYQSTNNIALSSDQLMFCSMLSGKKIMHDNKREFETTFLPHESFIMAPNQVVQIDFPDATNTQPTSCLAIEISSKYITKVCEKLNIEASLSDYQREWQYDNKLLHIHHNTETQALLNRMIHIFTENHQDRDFMVNLSVSELITRLLREQTREFILCHSLSNPEYNGINNVVAYLHQHLKETISIDNLTKISCMSRTKFFNEFKRIIGCTPQDFLFQLRLRKAADLLKRNQSVTQTCFATGYLNTSHFSRSFKKCFGVNPSQYKQIHNSTNTQNAPVANSWRLND